MAILVLIALFSTTAFCQLDRIYLFPGQGSDFRIFDSLLIDSNINKIVIDYPTPKRLETLEEYALRIKPQIDSVGKYGFIGVSLGGMIATEITKYLQPEITFIVSSAKTRNEIPLPVRLLKKIPLNNAIPALLYKWGSFIAQPIFEPERVKNKDTFKAMLKAKDPKFLKHATYMISNWENELIPKNIFHIHGNEDNTLPIKYITPNVLINDGSHMMMLTRGKEISAIIQEQLNTL